VGRKRAIRLYHIIMFLFEERDNKILLKEDAMMMFQSEGLVLKDNCKTLILSREHAIRPHPYLMLQERPNGSMMICILPDNILILPKNQILQYQVFLRTT
jgi:hypothetical protein